MDSVLQSPFILIVLILIVLLLFVWVGLISYQLGIIRRQQWILNRGIKNKNIYEVLTSHISRVDDIEKWISDISTEQDRHRNHLARTMQYVGLVRYNAFDDVGGDLSFGLALLDEAGNGVLLSTICGRQETRTYAKDIKGGKAAVSLTDEEKQAIDRALSRR